MNGPLIVGNDSVKYDNPDSCLKTSQICKSSFSFWPNSGQCLLILSSNLNKPLSKVIIEKSRGEGSLKEQETIENVS